MHLLVILVACVLAAPLSALAETGTSGNATYSIPALEVSATITDEPLGSSYALPQSAKHGSWRAGREDIEAMHAANLYEVVQHAPGVHVSFQGRKSMNYAQGRGGGLYAIVLDGVYLPWTQSGRIMADFPTDAIESVTVVRDSTVLTLGPLVQLGVQESELQGFILIRTRTSKQAETEARLGYASQDRSKAFVRHGNAIDAFTYSLTYNKSHDDGHEDWNNGHDSDSVLGKVGYDANGLSASIGLYVDWASRQIQRATSASTTSDSEWEYDPLNTVMLSATAGKKWTASQTTTLGFYLGQVETDLIQESYSKPTRLVYDQEDRSTQFDLRHAIATGDNTLTVGGQAIFWETPTGQFYYETLPREEELYAGYVQDEYRLTEHLTLDAGLRVERKHITEGVDKSGPTQVTAAVIEDQWATPAYNVSTGLAWWLSDAWKLSARTSVQRQGADDFLTTVDDKDLANKVEWRRELGVSGQLHRLFNPSLTLFSYDIRNLKTVVASIGKGADAINVYDDLDVVRQGLEVGVNGVLVQDMLNYGLSYSWQTSDSETDRRTLPENMISANLGFIHAPFRANLLLKYVGAYDSNFFSTDSQYHEIGDYARVDANVSYDFNLWDLASTLTVYGQNLLDDRYETRLGWKDTGLIAGLELAVKF